MTAIPLSRGYVATVSDADAHLADLRWCANVSAKGTHVYGRRYVGGKALSLHHAILGKPPAGLVVDHINGDTLDNRRENLRFVTQVENLANRKAKPDASHRGVEKRGNRYRAEITRDKRRYRLGQFGTAEAAAAAIAGFLVGYAAGVKLGDLA